MKMCQLNDFELEIYAKTLHEAKEEINAVIYSMDLLSNMLTKAKADVIVTIQNINEKLLEGDKDGRED